MFFPLLMLTKIQNKFIRFSTFVGLMKIIQYHLILLIIKDHLFVNIPLINIIAYNLIYIVLLLRLITTFNIPITIIICSPAYQSAFLFILNAKIYSFLCCSSFVIADNDYIIF